MPVLTVCSHPSLTSVFALLPHSCYHIFLKNISLVPECCFHCYMIFDLSAFEEGTYSWRCNNYFIEIIYSSEHGNDARKLSVVGCLLTFLVLSCSCVLFYLFSCFSDFLTILFIVTSTILQYKRKDQWRCWQCASNCIRLSVVTCN